MKFLRSIVALCCITAPLGASDIFFPIIFNKHLVFEQDSTTIPFLFRVKSFTCSGDAQRFLQETQELLEMQPGAFVTREQFLQRIKRLAQKNCFEKGVVHFSEQEDGMAITFEANCYWIVRSIKLTGIAVGKDEYLKLYEQSVGEPFSKDRHEVSVRAIQKFLYDAGYKQACVEDAISYDDATKTVSIVLALQRGKMSTISKVACLLDNVAGITDRDRVQLEALIVRQLFKKKATQQAQGAMKAKVTDFLTKHDYSEIVITTNEQSIAQKKIKVTVSVSAGKQKKIMFVGNQYMSSQDLLMMFSDRSVHDIILPSMVIVQEIQSAYQAKGFWNVSIESVEDGVDRHYFIIKEGQRSCIKKIVIKGAEQYKTSWLIKKFLHQIKNRFFDEKAVAEAIDALLDWYRQQGFWDATVVKRDYLLLDGHTSAYALTLTINEGTRRLLTAIDAQDLGIDCSGLPFLKELHEARKPIPFSLDILRLQKAFLLKKLRDQGYVHARVFYDIVGEPDVVTVVWKAEKGKRVVFGKTITRGYTTIPYEHLMKLVSYQEGQVWNKEKVQSSLTALRSLDVFERVALHPSFQDSSDDQRDMIFMVKDDDPFELKVRVGFAQVSKNFYFKKGSTYKAGGSFIWRNPLAYADRFALDVDYNRYEKRINASYTVPALCTIPLLTTFKVYANKYIQPVYIGSNKPLYQVLQQGFLIGLSKKTEHCDLGLTSGFDWMETNDLSVELARAINFSTDLVDKKIPYFFIEPMVYADFLNQTLNPTKGFFCLASLKGMFPFKHSTYLVKLLAEQGTFIPFDPAVLAIRFRAGHIFRRSFKAVMPPERFYLGGPFSLRGYIQDHCPPLGVYAHDGQVQYVPQGGKTMFNANFEVRFPVGSTPVWGTVFQDFGILIEDIMASGIGTSRPLAASGFGIRYMTPVGPLRFDIGWKWSHERCEEPSYAWFLTFGNAF